MITGTATVHELLRRHADAVEEYLRGRLPRALGFDDVPPRLVEAMTYSLHAGGKRLRPALVLESFHACSREEDRPHPPLSALAAAAAIELIHTFSLVHDDLPAMDDDDLRRGKPTSHKVFGEAMAILAGDAMTTGAFELIAGEADPILAGPLIRELASAAGPRGMIGGQVLDIAAEGQSLDLEALQDVHRRKTGALLTCACRMGAICAFATADRLAAVTAFGRHLGLAFQIADDLLDVTSDATAMGKATGKDAAAGKNTYPTLLGLDAARAAAQREADLAIEALSELGDAADGLRAMARFAVERSS